MPFGLPIFGDGEQVLANAKDVKHVPDLRSQTDVDDVAPGSRDLMAMVFDQASSVPEAETLSSGKHCSRYKPPWFSGFRRHFKMPSSSSIRLERHRLNRPENDRSRHGGQSRRARCSCERHAYCVAPILERVHWYLQAGDCQHGAPMVDMQLSEAERQFGLNAGEFPFRSHFAECSGARVHYVDEGSGPVLLMVHGNPTWSFLYRHLVLALRDTFRCIALDLPGFGLSKPPPGFGFRPDEHAVLVSRFLENLDVTDATLIGHDWGGPIGLAAMLDTGRITALCLGNTFAWPVNGDFHYEWFSKLMGGAVGRFACNRFAVFINVLMPAAMRRRKLTKAEMASYRAPFADPRSRTPMHIFPQQITGAKVWLQALESRLPSFKGRVHFVWPKNDFAFRDKELAHWLRIFPAATVTRLTNCGHYLWEDAPKECAQAVRSWMASTNTNPRPL